ncbi:YidH family protein [Arcticibacter sp. MXS-1]|uniref:YidH family protein n=1 Tax=Arcticibacter sp. MXS-1 TaxID=3341726 RepID=UPI0035A92FDF
MTPDTPGRKTPIPNDHLANERTFLAWIRTCIAIIGLGFVVVKFSLFVRQISFVLGEAKPVPGSGFSSSIGISLVGLGGLMAILSYWRYRHIEQQLLKKDYYPSFLLSLLLTAAIILISMVLLWYLVPAA